MQFHIRCQVYEEEIFEFLSQKEFVTLESPVKNLPFTSLQN